MVTGNEPAFPRNYAFMNPEAGKSELKSYSGMTIKQFYAGLIMSGLLSVKKSYIWVDKVIAEDAVAKANALIEALNKDGESK